MLPELSRDEILRYSRHLLIPEVGLEGQRKLKNSSVLNIGTGGLGSPVSLYLAAAGIGRIGLVDYDTVDSSNLQRQVIHGINGSNISDALNDLTTQYPALKPHLFNDGGDLRPFVNLFVGENNIKDLQGVNTPIKDGEKIMLIPSIAGGTNAA